MSADRGLPGRRRTVAVHRGPLVQRVLTDAEELSGEEIIPGFTFSVKALFAGFDYGPRKS